MMKKKSVSPAVPLLGAAVSALAVIASMATFTPAATADTASDGLFLSDYQDWSIVTFGDARMTKTVDGQVAVGGTLSFTGGAGATTQQSDPDTVSVVAQHVDLTKNSNGTFTVGKGLLRLGDADNVDVLNSNGSATQPITKTGTRVVPKGMVYEATPRITVSSSTEDSDAVVDPTAFTSRFSKTAAEQLAQQAENDSQGVNVQAESDGAGMTTLTLTAGKRNYWRVSADDLAEISTIKFADAQPSVEDGTFLTVLVDGETVTFNTYMYGPPDASAILWDAPAATTITQKGNTIYGSILAPKATLNQERSNINGTIIVDNADLDYPSVFGQGFYPYKGTAPVAAAPTNPGDDNNDPSGPVNPLPPVVPPTTGGSTTPSEPSNPSEPSQPGAPVAPTKPTNPGESTEPVEPTTPAMPTKPSQPAVEPSDQTPAKKPDNTVTPSAPTDTKKTTTKTEEPKADGDTGGNELATTGSAVTPIAFAALALMLAAAGAITYKRLHANR